MPLLHWLTREQDLKAAGRAPYRLLEPVSSHGDPAAQNMLIQGDNLEALKALLPYYAGKVKCIYIDPPYNTKSAFEQYDDNLEHSWWLSVLYPRLEILRDLLQEDGAISISIDDNESHYLKVICDEIFGRKNFIANVIWQKKYAPKADSKLFSESHDHIIFYAKSIPLFSINRIEKGEKQTSRYTNRGNDPRGPWKPGDVLRNEVRDYAIFEIELPSGRKVTPPHGTSWRYTKEKFQELISDNRIWFGVDGNAKPAIKRFLDEVTSTMPPVTIWTYDEVGHNDESKKESKELFKDELFSTPKPERLISRILHLASNPGDLVLDSFLGSGTTAAVAHKMGRRYIGVEIGEHAVTHCIPRLEKVIAGEQGGISKAVNWQGGGGFRFYRLGEAIFDEEGRIRQGISFAHLGAHVWFSETGRPMEQPARGPLLGVHGGVAYYLLYNGVLGDKRTGGGNVLTSRLLDSLPAHDGPKVVYGERSMFSLARMKERGITFKHTPYDIKGRQCSP